jgi:dTDP-4-dehydrorhamnose 3,5-epimerase
MLFHELPLGGAFLIEPERKEDERGFFARAWCREEFAAHGMHCDWAQFNISYNRRRGTLRGLHYQEAPWGEPKLVRCTAGAIYDVIVDLRSVSLHYGSWTAVELSARSGQMLYIPDGFAHGFQTLTDDVEILYMMGQMYHPEAARGLRWDDPILGIVWPECDQRITSVTDQKFPDFVPLRTLHARPGPRRAAA